MTSVLPNHIDDVQKMRNSFQGSHLDQRSDDEKRSRYRTTARSYASFAWCVYILDRRPPCVAPSCHGRRMIEVSSSMEPVSSSLPLYHKHRRQKSKRDHQVKSYKPSHSAAVQQQIDTEQPFLPVSTEQCNTIVRASFSLYVGRLRLYLDFF